MPCMTSVYAYDFLSLEAQHRCKARKRACPRRLSQRVRLQKRETQVPLPVGVLEVIEGTCFVAERVVQRRQHRRRDVIGRCPGLEHRKQLAGRLTLPVGGIVTQTRTP